MSEFEAEPPIGTKIKVAGGRVFERANPTEDFHWSDGTEWYRWEDVRRRAERERGVIVREQEELAAKQIPWAWGHVVEDRWGLRWRADMIDARPSTRVWQCRSVGLKIWRSSEKMLERGPLTFIRKDPIFTQDPALQQARRDGHAADKSVVVDGDSAETGDLP